MHLLRYTLPFDRVPFYSSYQNFPDCSYERSGFFSVFWRGNNPRFYRGKIKELSDLKPPLVRGGGCGEAADGGVVFVISPSVLADVRTAPSSEGAEQSAVLITRLRVACE